jgi:hypothetical protein
MILVCILESSLGYNVATFLYSMADTHTSLYHFVSSCYTLGSQHLLNVYLLYNIWHAYFLFFFLLNSGLFFYLPNWNLLLGIDSFKFLGIWLPPHSDVHMKKKYERLSLLVLFIIHILNEDRECSSLSKCLFFSFMDLYTTCFHKYTVLGYIKQL